MKPPTGQLYGDVLRSRTVTEFTLVETMYSPGLQLPKHSHEFAYFCLVLHGTYTEAYAKQTRLCRPSTLVFHPPEEVHSDTFQDAGARCFNIRIERAWLKRLREFSVVLDSPIHFNGGPPASFAMRIYKEFRAMDGCSALAIEGIALELLAEATRKSVAKNTSGHPPWLEQARQLLHSQFTQNLTLSYVAETVGVHPVHLAREFRRRYGCTMGEYTRQLRIEFACTRLSSSTTPLAEVALAAGFSHQSHFSRTFKRLRGMTPAQYRAAFRSC